MIHKYKDIHLAFYCLCSVMTGSLVQSDTIVATSMLPLTQEKINLISFAAELSLAAYNEQDAVALGANYFDTGADAALTLETGNYCFVAFRGSIEPFELTQDMVNDWLQNFNFDKHFVTNRIDSSEGCMVQEGFYDAYSGVGRDRITNFIDKCISDTDKKKQLVLTGHSQGGAAAAVAAVVENHFKPLTITFGQPPFLSKGEDCSMLSKNHIWRFINTKNADKGLFYDPIPFGEVIPGGLFGDHIGASAQLPPDTDTTHLVYRSKDETGAFMDLVELDMTFSSHSIKKYFSKLEFLRQYAPDPLLVDGYLPGTSCNNNFECQTFVQSGDGGCINSSCSDKLSDDSCERGTDCYSGRCDYTWDGKRKCYEKKPSGSMCDEDNDCQSGQCTWRWVCD